MAKKAIFWRVQVKYKIIWKHDTSADIEYSTIEPHDCNKEGCSYKGYCNGYSLVAIKRHLNMEYDDQIVEFALMGDKNREMAARHHADKLNIKIENMTKCHDKMSGLSKQYK